MENALAALWVLVPTNRDTRMTRRFRLVLEDARHGDAAAPLVALVPIGYDGRLARLKEMLADRPHITIAECRRGVVYSTIVREAAEESGHDPKATEAVWRLLSGLTHGDAWAPKRSASGPRSPSPRTAR